MFETILVPLDGSTPAEQALEQAQVIAGATGASLVLMSVVPQRPNVPLVEASLVPFWQLTECQTRADQAARYLAERARRLQAQGLQARTKLAIGRPATEILRTSMEQNVDLIVLATYGRSRVRRWICGSVALEVLQDADVPVLLVRATEYHEGQPPEQYVRRLQSTTRGSASTQYGA